MKFKYYFLIISGFLLISGSCQTNSDNLAGAEFSGSSVLGSEKENFELNRKSLNKTEWFTTVYKDYKPDESSISRLHKFSNELSFIVFGGSWCSDTKKSLPKFYKVVEEANIPAAKIALFGVDHDKHSVENKSGKKQSDRYNITRVPTFIVFYNNKEIGRLNEKTERTLEEDMVELIAKSQN